MKVYVLYDHLYDHLVSIHRTKKDAQLARRRMVYAVKNSAKSHWDRFGPDWHKQHGFQWKNGTWEEFLQGEREAVSSNLYIEEREVA